MPRRLLFLSATCLALTGCGSETELRDASDTPGNKIVVTTENGDVVEFTDFTVSCPPDATDQWGQDARVVQAVAGAYGTAHHVSEDGMILTAGDGIEERLSLPHAEEWGNHDTFVTAFVSRAGQATELSSETEASRGRIEVLAASCNPKPSLELKIDGELASEAGDGHATVKGHITLG